MRQQLLDRLISVQNTAQFINQDIMTFTGFLDDNELIEYVARYESMI